MRPAARRARPTLCPPLSLRPPCWDPRARTFRTQVPREVLRQGTVTLRYLSWNQELVSAAATTRDGGGGGLQAAQAAPAVAAPMGRWS